MSAYIIVDVKFNDTKDVERYRAMVPPSLVPFGGRFIVRGGKTQVIEGVWQPNRVVVIEFDNAERAKAWWDSEEYREAKALRQRIADTNMILVEGV